MQAAKAKRTLEGIKIVRDQNIVRDKNCKGNKKCFLVGHEQMTKRSVVRNAQAYQKRSRTEFYSNKFGN